MWMEFLVISYSLLVLLCLMVFIALMGRIPLRVKSGLVMLPACALLSFGAIMQTILLNYSSLLILYYFNTMMFLIIITSFVFFVGEFTGRFNPYSKLNLTLVLALPIIVTFSVLSDPWLHLYNTSYEIATIPDYEIPFLKYHATWMNWIWTAYCFIVGIVFMVTVAKKLYNDYNRFIFLMFFVGAAFCLPLNLGGFFFDILVVMPLDGLTFTLAALFFYIPALGFGIFDIAPVARKKMLDVMQDAIYILDPNGTLSDVNTAGMNLVRMDRQEIIGNPLNILFDKIPELGKLMTVSNTDTVLEMVDGDGRIIEAKRIPFEYGKIHQKGNMLVLHDVTERRKIEEMIRESETQIKMAEGDRKYRTLINNQTEAIITFDDEGRITFGNPVFERFMKGRVKNPSETNIGDILTEHDAHALWALIGDATIESPVFHFEHAVPFTDGGEFWYHWQGKVIFDHDGKMVEVQAAGINITDKKRNEAEYQAIVECQKEMIVRRTKDEVINFVNQAFSSFFHIPIHDLVGTKYFPPAEESEIKSFLDAVGSLTPEIPDRDFLLLKVFLKDDVTRWTEWKVRGIFDSNGRLVEYQCVGNDITDRLKMEQELIKSQKLESIGLLAGGIAHDFNNLLSSVVSNIEVASAEMPIDLRSKQRLDEAVRSAMSARRLTQQLLTFSKGGKPVKEPIDIATLIATNVEFTLTGSNVIAEYSIAEDVHQIYADPFQMGQVINNLVINAVHAMPDGGKITVQASNFHAEGKTQKPFRAENYVKIAIIDHGVGIPAENLTKIFDPFFTTKEKGTGLGLSTVQSIVRNHGGFIDVESTLEVGSIFTIFLPACETSEIITADRPCTDIRVSKARILIMDDEESILDVLSIILSDMGHDVEIARNGEEAIDWFVKAISEGRPFDLLIIDLTIKGGMGGKDAVGKILEIDPNIKAIVSSGYSNDPVMSDPRRYGFIEILQKPYTIQDLRSKLSAVLK